MVKRDEKMSKFGSTPRNLNVCIYAYLLGMSIINCHFNLRGNERSPEAKKIRPGIVVFHKASEQCCISPIHFV